jgi:hypothetical protein
VKNNNADFTYYYVDHDNGEFAAILMWIWSELRLREDSELSWLSEREHELDDVSWLPSKLQ